MSRLMFTGFDYPDTSPQPDTIQAGVSKCDGRVSGSGLTLSGCDTVNGGSFTSVRINYADNQPGAAGTGASTKHTYVLHYERFYFRIRQRPGAGGLSFWSIANSIASGGTSEGTGALFMTITAGGGMNVYNRGNSAEVLLGGLTGDYADGKWHRASITCKYNESNHTTDGPDTSFFAITIDDPYWKLGHGSPSNLTLPAAWRSNPSFTGNAGAFGGPSGFVNNRNAPNNSGLFYTGKQGCVETRFFEGMGFNAHADGGVIDIDDFVADSEVIPGPGYVTVLRPVSMGTYQQWATNQDYRALLQRPPNGSGAGFDSIRNNTVSVGPRVSVRMESPANFSVGQIKAAAAVVYASTPRSNWKMFVIRNGTLIDSVAASGTAPAAAFRNPDVIYPGQFFFQPSVAGWNPNDAFEVGFKDGDSAGAGTAAISNMALMLEHEREDPPVALPPSGDIQIATGSYVGNGTLQDIALPFKPQFLLLKPDGFTGVMWHEYLDRLGSYAINNQGSGHTNCGLAQVADSPSGGGKITVVLTGFNNNHVNDAGVTVRYLAIRDPKRRMMMQYSDTLDSGQTTPAGDNRDVTFEDPSFAIEAMIAYRSHSAGLGAVYYRGASHVGDSSAQLDAVSGIPVVDAIQSMGTGTAQFGSQIVHTNTHFHGAVMFRSVNVFNQKRLCYVGQYTGDGAASRTISFPFPLYNAGFLLVLPKANRDRLYRFGEETGTGAHNYSGGTARAGSLTAFTQNGFTVTTTGSTNMNANAEVYDYIAFAGGVITGPAVCFGGAFSTSDPDEITFPLDNILAPLTWVEFLDVKNTLEVWSKIALPDPAAYFGGFKDHIVQNWGTITRGLSDRRGQYEGAEWNFTVSDTDGRVRTKLGNFSTQYFTGRGITARMIDDVNRRLGRSPRTVVKGFINKYRPLGNRLFEFNVGDTLSVKFNSQNSNEQLPQRLITKADFPNALDQPSSTTTGVPVTVGEPVPIIYGKITDRNNASGGVDDGDGQYPGVYVGQYVLPDALTYHKWVIAGHAVTQIDGVYIDNGDTAGGGTNPPSSNIGDLTVTAGAGGDWVIPGYNNWPTIFGTGAPLYEDINGNRYTVVYGKVGAVGPDKGAGLTAAANDKSVPLAFSVAGIEDRGDGTGCLIVDGLQQYKHFMINWVFNNYKSGAWFNIPTFPDDPALQMIDGGSFDQCSLDAQDRIPGVGYQGDWSLGAGGLGMTGGYQEGRTDLRARSNRAAEPVVRC
jgi:hypothetical protein